MDLPLKFPALKIDQPLGLFYVSVLPAELMLDVCFSDQLRATRITENTYQLEGTQRNVTDERLRLIASYLDRYDSAFPNSIILAANYKEEDGTIEEDTSVRWSIASSLGACHELHIPSRRRLAAVIDGQHRLFAFKFASAERLHTNLICSIFLDLPKPFQAQLFATINSTQRPVDKSLTYELFGYNIAEEAAEYWSPDKLAVFLARKLNVDSESRLKGRIIIAPENDFDLRAGSDGSWQVSMATIVEGILRLISSNPKQDTNELLTPTQKTREVLRKSSRPDKSPLREAYLDSNDRLIYTILLNFLEAADEVFWKKATGTSFIIKTVGVQALLDILRKLCASVITDKDLSVAYFRRHLDAAGSIDFAGPEFRNASGSGRSFIRRSIEQRIGLRP